MNLLACFYELFYELSYEPFSVPLNQRVVIKKVCKSYSMWGGFYEIGLKFSIVFFANLELFINFVAK